MKTHTHAYKYILRDVAIYKGAYASKEIRLNVIFYLTAEGNCIKRLGNVLPKDLMTPLPFPPPLGVVNVNSEKFRGPPGVP